jgi:predicted GNAT family acetyltransferase
MSRKFDLEIRKATQADIFLMIELLGELFDIEKDFAFDFHKHKIGLEMLLASQNAHIFVATSDDKVVAMASIQTVISSAMGSNVGLIEDVVVKNEYRGKGIAQKVIEYIFQYAKTQNFTRLHLLCDIDNLSAEKFYKKIGFKPSELKAWYYFL